MNYGVTKLSTETNSLYSKIEEILKSIPELITEEKELRYNKIKEMAENGESTLLIPLIKDKKIKDAFFAPVLDSFVFKTKEFKDFLDYSSSNNSYSQHLGKRIGLYTGDSSLLDRTEVVLNFPYKDCVLEGGQKKEDGLDTYFEYDQKKKDYVEKTDKRREVFFNEVLAKDEIDSLFSPKAFCNVKKFTEKGAKACTSFERDAELNRKRGLSEDTITDNLIVKGNNLLALHSLKEEFEGKVKLIYIDPPYNTGSDDFKYNDNFNHSSWLTFMKNRLEVARDLLREDGCIFVQCDDNEQAYLKVLMDEVYGQENKLSTITVKVKAPSGVGQESFVFDVNEYILIYSKNINLCQTYIFKEKKLLGDNTFMQYSKIMNIFDTGRKIKTLHSEKAGDIDLIEYSDFNIESIKSENKNDTYYLKNVKGIFRTTNPQGGLMKKLLPQIPTKGLYSISYKPSKGNKIDGITYYFYNGGLVAWLSDSTIIENGKLLKLNKMTNLWDDNFFQGIAKEGNVELNGGKKPEKLIERILLLSTKESDIVLDYHLGSGTTAAVAHKMNRQYIGVEQLDYGENDSVVRLQNVINGDTTGISKSVNWQGGGSFVYMELAERNERALKMISACKSLDELISIFETLCNKYFLHYNVRVNEFINKICKESEFKKLSLKRQKEIFARMIDLNQLYVNLDDRNDKDSGLTVKDIQATENFYQLSKDGE